MRRIKRKKEIQKGQSKSFIKKFWWFVWESNSVWSWIVDLILLYILVRFIFFPSMSLIAGSSLPSVIVESDSMHHIGNFDTWWVNFGKWYEEHNISKQEFVKWNFPDGIDKGDIIIVYGRNKQNIEVGDVVVFDANQPRPIIHRVIKISDSADSISTKGDNNIEQLAVEKNVSYEKIIGKAIFRIPKIGWAKLFFVEIAKKLVQ
jgi:hypothetical protein